MLNVVAIEGVVLEGPTRITSKKDENKFFAFMKFVVPPYDISKEWLRSMISQGRKTGSVFIYGITIEGWPTVYALKNLKRGDLVGVVGNLSMMNSKENDGERGKYKLQEKPGIRIREIQKIMGNVLKNDTSKIARAPTMISPGQSQARQNRMPENHGSYQRGNRDNGILDDTEFNFEG